MSRNRIDPKLPIAPTVGDDPAVPLMKPDRYFDRLVRRLNELFRDFVGTLSIYDEGTYLGEADGINLVGSSVTASANTTMPGVYDITVTGGSGGGLTSPLTTKGDIWGFDTTNDRIPVGQDNYALVADSTQPLGVKYAALPQQFPIYVYFA